MTLTQLIESRASDTSRMEVLTEDGGRKVVSFPELVERARAGAGALAAHGVGPGDRVAAVASTSVDFILAAVSVWTAGGTLVPIPTPPLLGSSARWTQELRSRMRVTKAAALVGSNLPGDFDEDVPQVSVEALSRGAPFTEPDYDADSAALVQFSSGATARPKGVVISHRALAAQFEAFNARQPVEPHADHLVSWLPLYHDLGMVPYLLRPLAEGVSFTLIPTSVFLRDPVVWLREVSDSRATHSASPNFAYGLVARHLARNGDPEGVDLTCWRHSAVGGEAINPATLQVFCEATRSLGFAPTTLSPGYGLAEATCVVTIVDPDAGVTVDRIDRAGVASGHAAPAGTSKGSMDVVCVGRALEGSEVMVQRGDDLLPDREIGEVVVRAGWLMDGYEGDPASTAEVLAGGRLRTGDLGYVVGDSLYITGRLKDLIIVRGQNHYPPDLENIVEMVTVVRPGCVAVVGLTGSDGDTEEVVVVAETSLREPQERAACREAIAGNLWREAGLRPDRTVLVPPRSIPKTSSGKLQRSLVRAMLEKDAFEQLR